MNASTPTGAALVKTRPILFSAPMVRALLDGRKTQTRRIVKPQPDQYPALRPESRGGRAWVFMAYSDRPGYTFATGDVRCPYGEPGDLLWVRETFSGPHCMEASEGRAAAPPSKWGRSSRIWYWADGNPQDGDWTRPRPSIHMPRWASRLTLRITDVRVQRLKDITDADAVGEGIEPFGNGCGAIERDKGKAYTTLRGAFALLWMDVNGPGSWESNPFVWALTFDVLRGNIAEWAPV